MTTTMDFFSQQESARKRTTLLIALFALAVIIILTLTYIATAVFILYLQSRRDGFEFSVQSLIDPVLLLVVGSIVLAVVGGASLARLAMLRAGGGRVVAEMLGGTLIDPSTRDPAQRVLINVVEEMAIASGVPSPPVYMMADETGINAFAAGWSTDDAVIGVTRGAVTKLSRDELQGVIAHEFSHIFNGDMRMNIRLIGVLNGILVIGLAGLGIMRSLQYAALSGSRSSKRGEGGAGVLVILAFGLALLIIGYAGVFFGRIIKAAVSRQREYLADAAAVQFTRNPTGIAGALRKIGGYSRHGLIRHARADEASHMYFSEGVPLFLTGLFATHPPLEKRIRRIEPSWDGSMPQVFDREPPAETTLQRLQSARTQPTSQTSGLADAAALMASIGQPTADHLAYAEDLLRNLPPILRDAAHEPYSAQALMFALLLDRNHDHTRNNQWALLAEGNDHALLTHTRRLAAELDRVNDDRIRLPLVDLALPSLHQMSKRQYRDFTSMVKRLAEADQSISLFEWVLRRIIIRHLTPHLEPQRRKVAQFYKLGLLKRQLEVVLSTLALNGAPDREGATRAFSAAARELPGLELALLSEVAAARASLDESLDRLALATPKLKRQIVNACIACVSIDARITVREGELLRAICDALLVPVPPLLPGQAIATKVPRETPGRART